MRASLIPLEGGKAIELVKDVTVIGRKEFCDVRLEDASVSKVHLLIAKSDGLLLFRDMGSTNGTKVNGQRVIRGMLLPNDNLQIAGCKFQVQLLPSETRGDDLQPPPTSLPDNAVVRVFKAHDLARPESERMKPGENGDIPSDGLEEDHAHHLVDESYSSSTPQRDHDHGSLED